MAGSRHNDPYGFHVAPSSSTQALYGCQLIAVHALRPCHERTGPCSALGAASGMSYADSMPLLSTTTPSMQSTGPRTGGSQERSLLPCQLSKACHPGTHLRWLRSRSEGQKGTSWENSCDLGHIGRLIFRQESEVVVSADVVGAPVSSPGVYCRSHACKILTHVH